MKPFMILGRGGGHLPTHFTGAFTLMIGAYKKLGHGYSYTSAKSGVAFFFAAILYVDDTDLLLRAKFLVDSDKAFILLI